jgi:hypothetical protein
MNHEGEKGIKYETFSLFSPSFFNFSPSPETGVWRL